MSRSLSARVAMATCLLLPAAAIEASPLDSVFRLAAGGGHTCALDTNLNVYCWGRNDQGQLGLRHRDDRSRPTAVTGIGNDINAIAAGGANSCVLTNAGQVFCWGNNDHGQIGDGTRVVRTSAVAVGGLGTVTWVDLGAFHSCAMDVGGGVRCWGRNREGQLGDGTTTDRASAVVVAGLGVALDIELGGFHSCAITAAGGVRCWGSNEFGQLGNGNTLDQVTAVDVQPLGAVVTAISAGLTHTCALLTGGTVKCWGRFIGPTPTALGISNISSITAGAYHQCALTNAGGVLCMGWNGMGQLGDGSTIDRLMPVPVAALGNGVSNLAAGAAHTCAAMAATGSVRCWGDNSNGQLGFSGVGQ